jgi:hypothetical protein
VSLLERQVRPLLPDVLGIIRVVDSVWIWVDHWRLFLAG